MNIFQRIGFINKALNAIKELRKVIEGTTLDDELKEIFATLINCFERLAKKVPAIKDFIATLVDIIKKNFKIGSK